MANKHMKKDEKNKEKVKIENTKVTKKTGASEKRPKKINPKRNVNTKRESFDYDNEVIINLNVIPKKKDKPSINKKTKKFNEKDIKNETKLKKKKTKKNNKKTNIKAKTPKLTKEEQQKINKKNKKIKFILKCLIIIIITLGIMIFIFMSPIFNISKINVVGNENISSEQIISLSQIETGQNTYKMVKNKVKQNIKQNAYIRNVEINRILPNIIQITIKERHPKYMTSFGNAFVYIDSQGYMLEISETKLELPVIEGYITSQEDIKLGGRLCEEDLIKLDTVAKIVESANINEISNLITKINITDKYNYVITSEAERKKIYIGDASDINYRILIIKGIIEKEKGNSGELFLTDKNKPYFHAQE